ncbi:10186_t:CDS:2 [Acaulospora morrowiae]|uniref:Protein YOP1 n=1 Tax=Acaulospora morrowiae TaxID=94023 RepID=A0A9N9GMU1_9GLOM|nr:10186_t:CDS:2 [Acaulospora morrowiae]
MESFQAKFKYYNAQADKELSKYPLARQVESYLNVPKTYVAYGAGGFISLLIFFNVWGQLLSNIIGWGYPAYASFKAIETPDEKDDIQWLTYWTVFGFVNLAEFFSDRILYWMPFYYLFKTLFFLWLFLPPFKGAHTVYHKFLRPTLLAYQGDVDSGLKNIKDKAGDIFSAAASNVSHLAAE